MHTRQTGGALIEALLAMLILIIGVLGLIAMQANLLNHSSKARLRLQASLFANELIAMTIADNTNANCYVVPTASQSGCNSSIAKAYTDAWVAEVNTTLPGTAITPTTATLNGDGTFTVRLFWTLPQGDIQHNHIVTSHIGI